MNWISVNERLPEADTPVLAFNKGCIYSAILFAEVGVWYWGTCWGPVINDPRDYEGDDWEFTHWMPLPEPPTESGE